MRFHISGTLPAIAIIFTFVFSGCGSSSTVQEVATLEISGLPPAIAVDAHSHQGPHDGHIIELGRKHEFHAELVENHDSQSISIYILDHDMKELAIEEQTITLHLTAESKIQTFELVAVNPEFNKASRFDSTDHNLFHTLEDSESVSGKLRVTISGTPFVGRIAHHQHAGHDHR